MVAKLSISSPVDSIDSLAQSNGSIVSRIGKGFGALSTGAAVQVVGQLTVVPVALYAWGKVRYGEWLVLTGLVTFLRLTDLGLQTFVVNRMCASYARGERDEMQVALDNALRIQIPLVILTFAAVALALVALPIKQILSLETITSGAVVAVGLLLVLELLINVAIGIVSGIYRATGRLPRGAIWTTCQQFAVTVFTIGLIAIHSSFISLAAARVVIVIVAGAWLIYDVRRLYPWLHLWPSAGDWRQGLWMIGPGLFFIMIPIADYLSTQFGMLVLQKSLAGGEVSRLATHRTAINLSVMISGLLTNAMWPELTALHARSRKGQLMKAHRSLARVNMWLVGAVLFGLLPFLPMVYSTWTLGKLGLDQWTLAFLIARGLLWSIWISSLTVLCSINKQKVVAYSLVASAIVSGGLAIALIPRVGVKGAALAQLLGDLCVSAWLIPLLAVKATGDSYFQFLGTTATAFCKGLLIPIALGLLGWRLIHSMHLRFFVLLPLTWCLGLALMWFALPSNERSHIFHLARPRSAD
jgi:O-antigen/teichoic acid export membrane protein